MGEPQPRRLQRSVETAIHHFERAVLLTLVAMLMVVVALAILELGWILIRDVTSPPILILEVDELLELFGLFLLVLIGVELLEMMKGFFREKVLQVGIVLELGLIALARKVVVLDVEKYPGGALLAVAALIAALAVASHLRQRRRPGDPPGTAQ